MIARLSREKGMNETKRAGLCVTWAVSAWRVILLSLYFSVCLKFSIVKGLFCLFAKDL